MSKFLSDPQRVIEEHLRYEEDEKHEDQEKHEDYEKHAESAKRGYSALIFTIATVQKPNLSRRDSDTLGV